jgi:hypothetical protein
MNKLLATCGLGLMAAALPATADVYKCKQASGQLAYQDHPCGEGARDAGTVNSGYAAPVQGSDSAATHYQNYLNMMERQQAQDRAERRRLEAEDRANQGPQPMQADQRDYRVHQCQAQLDYELDHHRYARYTCDADGNRVSVPHTTVVVEPAAR